LASAGWAIWHTRNSPRIPRRVTGVLEESANPGALISTLGIANQFLPIR
jgi:hypothetical protein